MFWNVPLRPAYRQHTVAPKYNKMPSNLPNLRRLFVEARTEAEESAYSRNAFYNLAIFMSSVAIFGMVAQRMTAGKGVGA